MAADLSSLPPSITGLILAGGLGRRMRTDLNDLQDKGLRPFRGRPMVAWVIDRLRPQVDALVINANRQLEDWQALGHPLVSDLVLGHPGPLAGLHAAMTARHSDWWITVPCDAPFLPADLVERMRQGIRHPPSPIAVATHRGRWQPVFMLIHRSMFPALAERLQRGHGRLEDWLRGQQAVTVAFEEDDAFLSFNTPEEWARHDTPAPTPLSPTGPTP